MHVREVGKGPLFPADGTMGARLQRRARGIGVEVVAFALVTLLFPVLLIGAAAVDLVLWAVRRKPWMSVRLVFVAWWFLFAEVRAYFALLWIWLSTGGPLGRGAKRRRRLVYGLRIRWCRSHLAGARAIFGLRVDVEGQEQAGPGPALLFLRHASILDNTLGDALVGHPHRLGLRFVLKREIQMIPVIDIGGRWVPTVFVRRGSGDTAGELAVLRQIAQDLGPDEMVAIYPEGTRSSPAKIARAKEIVAERQPDVFPLAEPLRHLLPPRLGGPLALLESAPDVDVVFCGHVGLDGFAYFSDIWRGGLVDTTVKVKFWRVPAASIPRDERGRIEWLYGEWQKMDDWVEAQRAVA